MTNSAIDLTALHDSIVDVLARECGSDAVLRHVATGAPFDAALWKTAGELGWTALGVPDAHGGLDLGLEALALLYGALGSAIAPIPLLATSLAADAIARGGSAVIQETYLPEIANGSFRAGLSLPGAPTGLSFTTDGDWIVIDGIAAELLDAPGADLLIVRARGSDGEWLRILICPNTDGVAVHQHPTIDPTRSFGSLHCANLRLPADRLFVRDDIEGTLTLHADLALASEAIGVGDAALALALGYLKVREQFGRVIGSFQALKHRVADHRTALVAARALVEEAVSLKVQPLAAAARAYACDVAAEVAQDVIQLHGGIGFTWEYPAHLFLKRALVNQAMAGGASNRWDRTSDVLAA